MRTLATVWFVLFLLASTAFAQQSDYDKKFRAGFDALNSGKLDEGIALFKECLTLRPEDPVSAYNIGCGHSKKSEPDAAFEWLDKSAEWGFGNLNDANGVPNIDFAPTDTDLTPLHADPRWEKFMEKMRAGRKALQEFCATAAVYVPKALEGAAEVPLLVVLHDVGKTKNDVVAGRWKKIADELGCALVAPSGKVPLKPVHPEKGMAWFSDLQTYAKTGYRSDERPVAEAVTAFQKTHKVAADRVFIAGEGQGAMLAFNIAISKPTFYKGVVMVDGVVNASLSAPRVAGAVRAGLRAHAVFDKTRLAAMLKGGDPQPVIDGMTRTLESWTMVHVVETVEIKEGEGDLIEAKALAALKSFAAAPAAPAAPVEAGTGK